jgi:hypothetical protein
MFLVMLISKYSYILWIIMGDVDVITVKVPRELKKKMKQVDMNWSQFIRESIERKMEEQRMTDASRRLDDIRGRGGQVSTEELVSWIREDRER